MNREQAPLKKSPAQRLRSWQFSISHLLWLMVMVAVNLAVWTWLIPWDSTFSALSGPLVTGATISFLIGWRRVHKEIEVEAAYDQNECPGLAVDASYLGWLIAKTIGLLAAAWIAFGVTCFPSGMVLAVVGGVLPSVIPGNNYGILTIFFLASLIGMIAPITLLRFTWPRAKPEQHKTER